MSSVEVIGKLMAGATGIKFVRGTTVAVLSKAELAGLLVGLSDDEMNLALAKYGCDSSSMDQLKHNVARYVTALAIGENWIVDCETASKTLTAIIELAINEVVTENLCPSCHGVGAIRNKICNGCDGTRHKIMSGRKKATAIGVTQVQWSRAWGSRYETVFEYVCGLDSQIKLKLFYGQAANEKTLQ